MKVIDISFKDDVGNQINFTNIDGSSNGYIEIGVNGGTESCFFTMSELETIIAKIKDERDLT